MLESIIHRSFIFFRFFFYSFLSFFLFFYLCVRHKKEKHMQIRLVFNATNNFVRPERQKALCFRWRFFLLLQKIKLKKCSKKSVTLTKKLRLVQQSWTVLNSASLPHRCNPSAFHHANHFLPSYLRSLLRFHYRQHLNNLTQPDTRTQLNDPNQWHILPKQIITDK